MGEWPMEPRQIGEEGRIGPSHQIGHVGEQETGRVEARLHQRHVGRFVEEGPGRSHRAHPARPRRRAGEHVAPDGLVEDEVLIDVSVEEDRPRDETHVPRTAGVERASFVGRDACVRSLRILADVDRVDGPDRLPVARSQIEPVEWAGHDRDSRHDGEARRAGLLNRLSVVAEVLLRETAGVARRVRLRRVRDALYGAVVYDVVRE